MENNVNLGLIIRDLEQKKVDYGKWKKYLSMYIKIMSIPNISKEILLTISQSLIDAEVNCHTDADEKSVKKLRLLLDAINLKINILPVKKKPITVDKFEFDERGFRKPEAYWTDLEKKEMLGIGQEIYQPIPDKMNIDKIYIDNYKPKIENPIAELLDDHKDLEKKLTELSVSIENSVNCSDLLAGKRRR